MHIYANYNWGCAYTDLSYTCGACIQYMEVASSLIFITHIVWTDSHGLGQMTNIRQTLVPVLSWKP